MSNLKEMRNGDKRIDFYTVPIWGSLSLPLKLFVQTEESKMPTMPTVWSVFPVMFACILVSI